MSSSTSKSGARRAIMLARMDCAPEHDAAFNQWYWDEHIPERVVIPGILSAVRFSRTTGPRYLAWYDLQSTATLDSEAYAALHCEWTERTRWILTEVGHSITRQLYEELDAPAAGPAHADIIATNGGLILHDVSKSVQAEDQLAAAAREDVGSLKAKIAIAGTRLLVRADNTIPGPDLLRYIPADHPRFVLAHVLHEQPSLDAGEEPFKQDDKTWSMYRRLAPENK